MEVFYGINTGLNVLNTGMRTVGFVQGQGDRAEHKKGKVDEKENKTRIVACNDEIAFHRAAIRSLTDARDETSRVASIAFRTNNLALQDDIAALSAEANNARAANNQAKAKECSDAIKDAEATHRRNENIQRLELDQNILEFDREIKFHQATIDYLNHQMEKIKMGQPAEIETDRTLKMPVPYVVPPLHAPPASLGAPPSYDEQPPSRSEKQGSPPPQPTLPPRSSPQPVHRAMLTPGLPPRHDPAPSTAAPPAPAPRTRSPSPNPSPNPSLPPRGPSSTPSLPPRDPSANPGLPPRHATPAFPPRPETSGASHAAPHLEAPQHADPQPQPQLSPRAVPKPPRKAAAAAAVPTEPVAIRSLFSFRLLALSPTNGDVFARGEEGEWSQFHLIRKGDGVVMLRCPGSTERYLRILGGKVESHGDGGPPCEFDLLPNTDGTWSLSSCRDPSLYLGVDGNHCLIASSENPEHYSRKFLVKLKADNPGAPDFTWMLN